MKNLYVILAATLLLNGCATPTVIQTNKTGDQELSCQQLEKELFDAEKFLKAAEAEKNVSVANAARLVFWPLLVGQFANANEAIRAAEKRQIALVDLMIEKKCEVPRWFNVSR
jgi:hypothetical protein